MLSVIALAAAILCTIASCSDLVGPAQEENNRTSAMLNGTAGFGTRMEVLIAAAPNMELAWEMDASFVEKAKALGGRMQALGTIQRQPDYDRLFDLSFVKQAREKLE